MICVDVGGDEVGSCLLKMLIGDEILKKTS